MKLFLASIFLLCSAVTFAQQDPLFTMFWNNYALVNPAVSGLYYKHQASAAYRNQWVGVNGAPNSVNAGYNMKLDALHGGLGVTYLYDELGFTNQHRANLNYSYHFKIGENGILAAGISAGIASMKMDDNWIPSTTPSGKNTAFLLNAGVVYKARAFSVGLSSTNVNEPVVRNPYHYTFARHYVLFADYTFNIGNDFELKPQAIVRTDAVKISADFNVLATYRKQYWLGFTYRTSDALCFMAGWDILQKFRVGYSYDLTINQLSGVSRGSHEVVLGFMLKN